MENANTKILWETPFQLENAQGNGGNKIDIAVLDKQGKSLHCMPGRKDQGKNNDDARKVL